MAAKIPEKVLTQPLLGLNLINSGKVRDTYKIPSHSNKLLVHTTDRISIFDFVLPALVPQKGEVLTALTVFWLRNVLAHFDHHLVAYGSEIDKFLPDSLKNNPDLQKCAIIVKRLEMLPVECVVRGFLTGSGWKSYQENQTICDHQLPNGLHDGSRLPYPIFTPTTKAETGHDEAISANIIAEKYGLRPERTSLQLYQAACEFASSKGIIIADTKFEFGHDVWDGILRLGDEVLTPDSSRFWSVKDWEKAVSQGKSPAGLDKQLVREWGKTVGIEKRNPENPDDLAFVHSLQVPDEFIKDTHHRYRYIFYLLTGQKLEAFQRNYGIDVSLPEVKIDVVLGSQSDLSQAISGLDYLKLLPHVDLRVHIISCHRNPEELRVFAENYKRNGIIIAGASLAAALPGVLNAWLQYYKKNTPVIGVAFEGKNHPQTRAAQLSIEQLPGQPVILNSDGNAFTGSDGFRQACELAVETEFLPRHPLTKPAEIDINWRKL